MMRYIQATVLVVVRYIQVTVLHIDMADDAVGLQVLGPPTAFLVCFCVRSILLTQTYRT